MTNTYHAPAWWRTLLEARAPVELASLAVSRAFLRAMPHGDGHTVMVVPGFLAPDASTLPLQELAWEVDDGTPRFRAYRDGVAIGDGAIATGSVIDGNTSIGAITAGVGNQPMDAKLYEMFLLNALPTAPQLALWAAQRASRYGL